MRRWTVAWISGAAGSCRPSAWAREPGLAVLEAKLGAKGWSAGVTAVASDFEVQGVLESEAGGGCDHAIGIEAA